MSASQQHTFCQKQFRAAQEGVTLVELLVTVVIISVGLLGVAALHLTSLRSSYDSNNRSKAVWLVHDIADRMRANRSQAVDSGLYDVAIGSSATGTGIATTDVSTWKTELSSALPSGDGSISRNIIDPTTNATVFQITIQWLERGSSVTFTTQTEI